MRYRTLGLAALIAFPLSAAAPALAGNVTVYRDRNSFNNAAGVPLTLEDFTPTFHFPIRTGILNSHTNLPEIGILPGTIQPGVTYSTPIGSGNFFNIDAGGGYTGGFLDGFNPSDREVTIDFHMDDPGTPRAVFAFGFDIGSLGSTDFDVHIFFRTDPPQHFNYPYPGQLSFFGFVSDARDITRVVIGNNGGFFGFDFDNFTYDEISEGGFTLAVRGTCPGQVSADWNGAPPDTTLGLIFAANTGSFVIPGGVCAGTMLGLGSQNIRLLFTFPSGSQGSGSRSGSAGTAACGRFLQLISAPGCETSNVGQIP